MDLVVGGITDDYTRRLTAVRADITTHGCSHTRLTD
jgi:hypothetical protein